MHGFKIIKSNKSAVFSDKFTYEIGTHEWTVRFLKEMFSL